MTTLPKMWGFQAAGAAPIVLGHPVADARDHRHRDPHRQPGQLEEGRTARDESGGIIDMVTDDEIMEAYKLLASSEGVFAEPASAASIAGLKKLADQKRIEAGAVVVCTLTGHGLKDPHNAIRSCPEPLRVPADLDRVLDAMGI